MLGMLDSGRIGFEAICNVNFIFRNKDARFMSAGYQEMENFKESVEQQGHCDFNRFLKSVTGSRTIPRCAECMRSTNRRYSPYMP